MPDSPQKPLTSGQYGLSYLGTSENLCSAMAHCCSFLVQPVPTKGSVSDIVLLTRLLPTNSAHAQLIPTNNHTSLGN